MGSWGKEEGVVLRRYREERGAESVMRRWRVRQGYRGTVLQCEVRSGARIGMGTRLHGSKLKGVLVLKGADKRDLT